MDANQERFGCFSVSCTCDSIQIIVGLAGSPPFVNMVMIRPNSLPKGKALTIGCAIFRVLGNPNVKTTRLAGAFVSFPAANSKILFCHFNS